MRPLKSRIDWWRRAQFGVFIHWGLYSHLAGAYRGRQPRAHFEGFNYAEWIMANADIPHSKYCRFANEFNPKKFDARDWVDAIAASGAKYIVVTTKHHEGFCMFPSKHSRYNIVEATPYKKDPIAELARECKAAGIRLGLFYSILDWAHPAQVLNERLRSKRQHYHFSLIRRGRKAEYFNYMRAQLRELLELYDPSILWFDGEWVRWWTSEDGKRLENYLRNLKPSILINNRIGKRRAKDGDFGTPEQEVPIEALSYPWESCLTMNDTWGYSHFDKNWKSTTELNKTLLDVKSKGGNLLLNIGPTGEGKIPQPSIHRLKGLGELLRNAKNG